ncbi:MAG TPA: protein-glutamate O-methyltransferase CheR [Acidimicrobiales bacterium]|nr:protein-glutamate O-methyltransferase CheR [Acidimicrobiales bacterium]
MAIRVGPTRHALEDLELRLLLEGIYQHYGYDFREYARASLRRRVWRRLLEEGLETISALQDRLLHDPQCFERLLVDLSVTVTTMFRDPSFYQALREKVVPLLRTYPFVRVWNAGCSTGEETFSLAILLHEEGLGERARIYATDINDVVVRQAKLGTFSLEKMREYTQNYIRSGGKASFSDYYKVYGDKARFDPSLVDNVVFAQHNLVSDSEFNQFHLIVCRNVMIYFDRSLQDKVHDLFHRSLVRFGVLALGHKESLRFTSHTDDYEEVDGREKLWRRIS